MQVFISHSIKDKAAYSSLCGLLDGASIPCWNVTKMLVGSPVAEQLRSAMATATAKLEHAFQLSLDTYQQLKNGAHQVVRVERVIVGSGSRAIVDSVASQHGILLTMHIQMHRLFHYTNGLSKKIENHTHVVMRHMTQYALVEMQSKLRVSTTMTAGDTDRLWERSEIVALIEADVAKALSKRCAYKKKSDQFSKWPNTK